MLLSVLGLLLSADRFVQPDNRNAIVVGYVVTTDASYYYHIEHARPDSEIIFKTIK